MATSMLKQRLIGAAVLIALGVIFIPMLLTGDGKFLSGEMESNVPPKPMYELEAPKVLPLDKRTTQPSDPVVEPLPAPTETISEKTADASAANSGSKEQSSASQAEAKEDPVKADASSKSSTGTAPVSSPETSTSKKPVEPAKTTPEPEAEKPSPKPSVPAVKAETTSKPAEKPAPKTEDKKPVVSGWVVQLGSFSVQKNALKLRDNLRKKGHASFVEEFNRDGKTSYRVRVGPELTRELALELKKKLKAETKIDGFVIEFHGK